MGWTSKCSANWAIVRSHLTAASATFALKAGLWFCAVRLFLVSPVRGHHRRFQAETPIIDQIPDPASQKSGARCLGCASSAARVLPPPFAKWRLRPDDLAHTEFLDAVLSSGAEGASLRP